MEVIVYIIFFFSAMQFFILLANLVFNQKLEDNDINGNPLVSILIPARNEENNILNILKDIEKQCYKNIETIVFDDNSSDNTAKLILSKMNTYKQIQLIQSKKLPNGWLGKNWACHNLAQKAKGEYFLFLDADVRIQPNLITKTLSYAQKHKLSLLSIFPKQIMSTLGEKLTVPLMHYILVSLLPLILVRKSPFIAHSAANGQFMLFDSKKYLITLPHLHFKQHKVEDIKISRYFKKQKMLIACITGTSLISCKMYNNYKDALNGFSKNIVMFFGNSYLLALFFWLINTFGIVFIFIQSNIVTTLAYCLLLVLVRIGFSIIAKQHIVMNLLLYFPQMISMLVIITKSIIYKFTPQQWKGRYI